jgi:hypothetical protein
MKKNKKRKTFTIKEGTVLATVAYDHASRDENISKTHIV